MNQKLNLPWSLSGESYASKIGQMAQILYFSKDLGCLKTIKVERNKLSSTKWQNGLMFIWESHHAGGCWSAVGRVPGFIDSEYTVFQSILETGAPIGWQVVGFGQECGGDTGNAHHLYSQLQSY